jgi:hypothetical protein
MRASTILLAAVSALPAAAIAAGGGVTLYGGYRAGGGFTDAGAGQSVNVRDAGTVSASLDFPLDAAREVQFLVSRQGSAFVVDAPAATPGLDGRSMSVTYLHLGGTNFFGGQAGSGPYVVGGLGVTHFDPGVNGYSSATRPSMNIGIGYQLPLGNRLALRAEIRGYLTLVDSEGGLFCSGGCVVSIRGDSFTQREALIGVSVRF